MPTESTKELEKRLFYHFVKGVFMATPSRSSNRAKLAAIKSELLRIEALPD